MNTSLLTSREGRLMRLTLNRPERRNALNMDLCRQLLSAIHAAAADPDVGAVFLDASGSSFCAGMDLAEVLQADEDELLTLHLDLFTIGTHIDKPILAAVQGPAMAGALGLLANVHVVIASSSATFALTERRVGLWPYAIFHALSAAVGKRRATELSLTARTLTAEEALRIGLIDIIVPAGELAKQAHAIATDVATGSASALFHGLAFVRQDESLDSESAATLASEYRKRSLHSADFREGVKAFLEKREPVWPSHQSPQKT